MGAGGWGCSGCLLPRPCLCVSGRPGADGAGRATGGGGRCTERHWGGGRAMEKGADGGVALASLAPGVLRGWKGSRHGRERGRSCGSRREAWWRSVRVIPVETEEEKDKNRKKNGFKNAR